MVFSALAAIGVVSHASRRVSLPGEGWAYLCTSLVGLYVFTVFATMSPAPADVKVPVLLFLASGVASGMAAHVIDGGGGPRDG
jgi:hypothetical protein